MTYRLADADERAALDPAFGEGETTAIMREQWHEVLGHYPTVVAVVHVDDAAHVLEALTAHAVQPGDMPYEQAERAAEMYEAEPTDVARLLAEVDHWEDERAEVAARMDAGEAIGDDMFDSDDAAVILLRQLAAAVRGGK